MTAASREVRVRSLEEVVAEEREKYLGKRRELNGLPPLSKEPALAGLCLSGGGIRSATFCLGVMQALMSRNVFRRFDYLSTVSGGGYIGSCLSSIFAGEVGRSGEPVGLDERGSPFVGLRAQDEYCGPSATKLGVRHQMHHLRSHGEYLVPRSGLLSGDFQRFLGAGGIGIFYTFLIYWVALMLLMSALHLVFSALDPALEILSPPGELQVPRSPEDGSAGTVSSLLSWLSGLASAWWSQRVHPPLQRMSAAAVSHPIDVGGMAVLGALWVSGWILVLRKRASRRGGLATGEMSQVPAGWTAQEHEHGKLRARFNWMSLLLAGGTTLILAAIRTPREGDYLAGFWLPFAFATGAWVVGVLAMSVGETIRDIRSKAIGNGGVPERVAQLRRSLYDTLGGASLLGMAFSLLVPLVSVLVFSLARLPNKFFLAGILAVAGAWLAHGNKFSAIDRRTLLAPLLDCMVALFLLLSASHVSGILLAGYRSTGKSVPLGAASSFLLATALMLLLGFFLDPNRISPHHFYSDRLAEAYLRTDARVSVHDGDQKMPLVTIRDDEQLELRALGEPSVAPFHLIVAALNLSNSDELVRKRMKSDHFVFSGLHVGSRTTGFVKTDEYRGGGTRLATAVATSAAAVASAAGLNTRRSVAFLATLFNGRLGLWVENPGRYGPSSNPTRAFTFWPTHLLKEILGSVKGDTRLVNVSDGGHTGDNLGLLPLLQRRCEVIVVCDAEADAKLDFDALRNVVRMANVELNVQIEIDLAPVQQRRMQKFGFRTSEASVLEGKVHYPSTSLRDASVGRLIYIKSSLSRAAMISGVPEVRDAAGAGVTEGGAAGEGAGNLRTLPASVASYARECPAFPHQTTVDQFFDDAQFEAYRALGAFLGELAAQRMQRMA